MTLSSCTAEAEGAPETASTPWLMRGHNALLIVGALWLECVIVWLIWHWGSFSTLAFRDPDDAMRLVQIRDFLGGQSWFDVSQHRVNPPHGGPMHWSRLVDLPIAGMIWLLRPLVGGMLAEIIACVAIPMVLLGGICIMLYQSLRIFMGTRRALLTVALLATCFPILTQLAPLRIDHHGWQIAMATALMLGLLHKDARTGGWIMGGALALWLHISSEGLPYAALAGTIVALRYGWSADEWPRLIRTLGLLAIGSAALLLLTHGWNASFISYCDAMSPVYLAPLAMVFIVTLAGRMLSGSATIMRRIIPVTVGGGVGALLFFNIAGPCLAGPFQTLDPLVYSFWYQGVLEGLPIPAQDWPTRGVMLLPSLFGIAGLTLATWQETDAKCRAIWLSLLMLAIGGLGVALLVMRAMSVAHLFALPGLAWLIARLYPRIAALSSMPTRVLLTTALCILSPAGLAVAGHQIGEAISGQEDENGNKSGDTTQKCDSAAQVEALRTLPVTTIFAPIDIGPVILQRTSHRVIGTAHHRNVDGMGQVIHAFLAEPSKARDIIMQSGAEYLLLCPTLNEVKRYGKVEPSGLAARLVKEDVPVWLSQLPVTGMNTMRLYQIVR